MRIYDIFMHFSQIFGIIHIHIHTKENAHLRCFPAFQADFSALYTYTYTYTQMKTRIYAVFMHFRPIFRIIHIHIHTKILL